MLFFYWLPVSQNCTLFVSHKSCPFEAGVHFGAYVPQVVDHAVMSVLPLRGWVAFFTSSLP